MLKRSGTLKQLACRCEILLGYLDLIALPAWVARLGIGDKSRHIETGLLYRVAATKAGQIDKCEHQNIFPNHAEVLCKQLGTRPLPYPRWRSSVVYNDDAVLVAEFGIFLDFQGGAAIFQIKGFRKGVIRQFARLSRQYERHT